MLYVHEGQFLNSWLFKKLINEVLYQGRWKLAIDDLNSVKVIGNGASKDRIQTFDAQRIYHALFVGEGLEILHSGHALKDQGQLITCHTNIIE